MSKNFKKALLYIAIPVIFCISAFLVIKTAQPAVETKYYQIVDMVHNNEISSFEVNMYSGELKYVKRADNKQYSYSLADPYMFRDDVKDFIKEHNSSKDTKKEDRISYDFIAGNETAWISNMLPSLLIIGVVIVSLVLMTRKMNQTMGADKSLSFGKAKFKKADDKRKTTFADVAGADEEKEEMSELVEFLKSPAKFNELGARIPKGVLLVGPPGTGKTLLARAVAGEANVPFYSISGSDFVEMFVGVGASRVRDLFDQAKKTAPSIVFIDEIDAVGRQRGAGLGGGHDEREQTLNQLLVEMDGFGANEGVIVIAATNRPDILDRALLRPGRFDRQITVNYPDVKGREEILKVHARGKPLGPDVSLKTIAQSTAGFTGADLENLLNEAALLAARQNLKAITQPNIEEATIKVVMGTEKKSHVIKDRDKLITSYHEAGHAIVSYHLETRDPVHQISIIPRGMAAGYTMYIPTEEKGHISKRYLLEEICSMLGGRAAEEITQSDICTGASNDMQRATDIARKMVTKYGMSEKLGPVTYGTDNNEVFLGRDFSSTPNYSEKIAAEIDAEINSIISTQYSRAVEILKGDISKLHLVAKELYMNEKISGADFAKLMEQEDANLAIGESEEK